MKLKSSCLEKDTIILVRLQTREKLANHISERWLIPTACKKLKT